MGVTVAGLLALGLVACSNPTPPDPTLVPAPAPAPAVQPPPAKSSTALNAEDYRVDAATHLYKLNSSRIYPGVMPHFLYAIGVLEIQLDTRGRVTHLQWLRPPEHAPEVVAEIERTVRQASPFPAPVHLKNASYVDTWLWDRSGRFQLHTLSEGQGPAGTKPRAKPQRYSMLEAQNATTH
jgi:hypothetical protein